MHPKNKPPIFVPAEFVPEMERLTKAALMDLVWEMTTESINEAPDKVIAEIRGHAATIVTLREQD
jgi:hypothetical protein